MGATWQMSNIIFLLVIKKKQDHHRRARLMREEKEVLETFLSHFVNFTN